MTTRLAVRVVPVARQAHGPQPGHFVRFADRTAGRGPLRQRQRIVDHLPPQSGGRGLRRGAGVRRVGVARPAAADKRPHDPRDRLRKLAVFAIVHHNAVTSAGPIVVPQVNVVDVYDSPKLENALQSGKPLWNVWYCGDNPDIPGAIEFIHHIDAQNTGENGDPVFLNSSRREYVVPVPHVIETGTDHWQESAK